MNNFNERIEREENNLFDNRIIKIRPMYYSMDKIKWNFDEKLQNKIRNENILESKEITDYIPFTFYEQPEKIDASLYFPCVCDNFKSSNCHSSNCKFPFSKGSNFNESMLKDGLEIMDIPSTYLVNIEKKNKKLNDRVYNYDSINNYLEENRKINDDDV